MVAKKVMMKRRMSKMALRASRDVDCCGGAAVAALILSSVSNSELVIFFNK
jgi:hypothetical protein